MAQVSALIARDIEQYLKVHERKSLLRFIACGSVGDGRSTLIGRLLHESKTILEGPLAALVADSENPGTRGDELDYALLLDGRAADREQGIAIDVAYQFFSTAQRRFIVADTPGHEPSTRNTVTAASTADLAIILIDARSGVLAPTRRLSCLVSLLGIRRIVLAINKMDLVDYSQSMCAQIETEYRAFARRIPLDDITCIPISAVNGDNIVEPRGNTPWYRGQPLMSHLENVAVDDDLQSKPFRLPVQRVDRPDLDGRGFSGTIASGVVKRGDPIRVQPSGREGRVARIVTAQGDVEQAVAGQSISLSLDDEIDISRGDVVSARDSPLGIADQFEAGVVWMGEAPMLRGRDYRMKIGARTVTATIAPLKYKVNVDTLEHIAADTLELDEIGVCEVELDRAIAFEPYRDNRDLGGFILIDRMTNDTVGAGQLHFALRRSQNVHWQAIDIHKQARAALKGQKPCVIWFTGLSGSGKSTIANLVEKRLYALGRHTCLLDGDNVRHGLSKDLGFTEADRVENIRRVAEVAKLMAEAGLIVLTAFISPFRSERRMARGLVEEGEFIEVFVDTPLAVAEQRDTKGLYKKARQGQLRNFTGIDSPYEIPERPEIRLESATVHPDEAAGRIVEELRRRGIVGSPDENAARA
jgi:bifunctional enzyme CysN/CysC